MQGGPKCIPFYIEITQNIVVLFEPPYTMGYTVCMVTCIIFCLWFNWIFIRMHNKRQRKRQRLALLILNPAGTQRNNNVFITSKRRRRRRFDVMKTLSLRHYCVMFSLGIRVKLSNRQSFRTEESVTRKAPSLEFIIMLRSSIDLNPNLLFSIQQI